MVWKTAALKTKIIREGIYPGAMANTLRLLFVCPCKVHISGRPEDAKADIERHRRYCTTCKGAKYINTLKLQGLYQLKREFVIPPDQADITTTMVLLHAGVVPPGSIVQQMIHDAALPVDVADSAFYRLPAW